MTSLGFVRGHDFNAQPQKPKPAQPAAAATLPVHTAENTKMTCMNMMIVKGFFPLMLFSFYFALLPVLAHNIEIDYTDTLSRIVVLSCIFLAGFFVVAANCCVCWFNIALFFHIGIEVGVLQVLWTYAQEQEGFAMVLSWITYATIIVHLIPFLVVDRGMPLTVLAFVGLLVNAATILFVHPADLVLVSASAAGLLGASLVFPGIDCIHTSMLSNLRAAMKSGVWIKCSPYEK